ncbi:hypothetical protein LBMAG52_35950 [Planctomycetia bacterium]|nr:hypothetical protein LBMAG52_35950 [Planctomycetia bacterium]
MTERRSRLLVVAAVWLSFLLVSLVSAPIPAVNEPHYLAMARHSWDPAWCAGDLFLSSFPSHQVFYWTFGWLTLWFDFTTVALIGRAISLAMIAASWTSLAARRQREDSEHSSPHASALLSAWLFLGLQAIGNLSGEWLIGGFESKVVAYSLVFWSISAMLDRRLLTAAACGGAAISFHPIVGLWHLAAMGIAELVRFEVEPSRWRRWLVAIALLMLVALPGLWPAIEMLRAANARTSVIANYIQVYYRLKHHLDPMDFGVANYVRYGMLGLVWLSLWWWRRRRTDSLDDRWWMGYVVAAALFVGLGFAAGLGPRPQPVNLLTEPHWRMVVLKFYPFRLFDLLLPVAVAILLPSVFRQRWLWLLGSVGLAWAVIATRVLPPSNQLPSPMRADWRDACRWVAANTPANTVFHTPFEAEAFKWFGQRAEYVNLKDCPQDAAGVVEWNRRMRLITKWSEKSFNDDDEYSADELRELVRQTGVCFAITRTRVRYDADLLYSNDSYKILRLPDAEPSPGR